jgi:hypothetical protein
MNAETYIERGLNPMPRGVLIEQGRGANAESRRRTHDPGHAGRTPMATSGGIAMRAVQW